MFDVDLFTNLEPIDITSLLEEIDLPIRLVNRLKIETFYSVESFYKTVENLKLKYISSYLFPNTYVSFYPQVRERHAMTDLTCCLSGGIIKKGSLYCSYSPFIENLERGGVYTIFKRLHVESYYVDYLPQDLFTYEEWCYRIENCYYENSDGPIDFYFLSRQLGDNGLALHRLGKSKQKIR